MKSFINDVPDEILDLIIRAASLEPPRPSPVKKSDPAVPNVSPLAFVNQAIFAGSNSITALNDTPADSEGQRDPGTMNRRKLQLLGQVCVRWYNLTLPYIWSTVRLVQKHLASWQSQSQAASAVSGEGEEEGEKLKTFLDLLQARPLIAKLVEEVIFHTCEMSIHTLATIINFLPNLRYLVLRSTWIQPAHGVSDANSLELARIAMGGQSRTLENLYFDYNWHETRYDQAIIDIMSLFTAVDSLYLTMEPLFRDDVEPVKLDVPEGFLREMRVRELTVHHRVNAMRPWYTTLFRQLDVLSKLTCLEIACEMIDLNAIDTVGELIEAVAPTLEELCLCVRWSWAGLPIQNLPRCAFVPNAVTSPYTS